MKVGLIQQRQQHGQINVFISSYISIVAIMRYKDMLPTYILGFPTQRIHQLDYNLTKNHQSLL
ncbi:unnamed protein product [Paramecium sonneborni]|uniref:Uncharacterized protein n=1 Tax=Paramecium sonneborni TaxID=65129 RepID=A0A8S1RJ68_9CILI|nr:unnamed protein product [Paramecium sonneborni]